MTLLVISHTPHYRVNNQISGWSATIREINYLASIFDKVYHLAPLHEQVNSNTGGTYIDNVTFVPIPQVSGNSVGAVVRSCVNSYLILRTISRYLSVSDFFHVRLPTGMGLFLIPYLVYFGKNGWFKYAGNWIEKSKPLSYAMQKQMLQLQRKRKVTINGRWSGQRSNILSFENPCLTDKELQQGLEVNKNKRFDNGINLLFVGHLSITKGLDILMKMLAYLPNQSLISKLFVVGEGDREYFRSLNSSDVVVEFVGGLAREAINKYYEMAHILILPSLSEGFPKVVAEAAAYGCVPAVTNISALNQYIDASNGLIFSSFDPQMMAMELHELISDQNNLKHKSKRIGLLLNKFTYTYYLERVKHEILLV